MSASSGPIRARCDGSDRLVEADEPLAGLQRRSGGTLPGAIAIPALLALVRSARHHGIPLARTIRALDEDREVAAWASVRPQDFGSVIELSQWQALPHVGEAPASEGGHDLIRHLAEGYARLDSQQRVLSAEMSAPDLAQVGSRMAASNGRAWTDFVTIHGSGHRQPLHWRLLDGVAVTIEGSPRQWRAHLIPQPAGPSAGFELCLVPTGIDSVPARRPSADETPVESYGSLLAREMAPALQQPINRIIANAETIRARLAGPLADQYSSYAADIADAGRHLLDLVSDLVDLEAVEAADFTPAPDRIDLGEVGRKAAGILSVRAAEKGISLNLPPEGGKAPAIGEFRRVLQVLLNLLTNAVRYSPEGTAVTVSCGSSGETAWIAVADEGPGLDEEQAAKVFEKFERLGRKGDGGSGLGLYISRRLARAMKGDLTVTATPGEGARFVLALPADKGWATST